MTSVSHAGGYNMEPPKFDDNMEIGTSPYRQVDDDDFDIDPMQDPSIDNSMLDDAEFVSNDVDPMQADAEQVHFDDDMVDEDTGEHAQDPTSTDADLEMQVYDGNINLDQDEDILYDEEEEVEPVAVQEKMQESPREAEMTAVTQMTEVDFAEDSVDLLEEVEEDADAASVTNLTRHDGDETLIRASDHPEDPIAQPDSTQQTQTDVEHQEQVNTEVVDFAESESQQNKKTPDPRTPHNEEDNTDPKSDIMSPSKHIMGHAPTTQSIDRLDAQDEAREDQQHMPSNGQGLEIETHEHDESDANHESGSGTTQTSYHPVKVIYLEQEMGLFPPFEDNPDTTFLLADPTLADDSFTKLLAACREVLGDSLEHDDEIVLDIPTLGLHISEDSKYASEISLSQVVEVYLALCRNDSKDIPEPMYCHLSSRVSLASQLAYISSAAREGKTYVEIIAEHADSPVPGESDYLEFAEPEENADEEQHSEEGAAQDEDEAQPDIAPEANIEQHATDETEPANLSSVETEQLVEAAGIAVNKFEPVEGSQDLTQPSASHEVYNGETSNDYLDEDSYINSTDNAIQQTSEMTAETESDIVHQQQPAVETLIDTGTPSSHTVEGDQLYQAEGVPDEQSEFDENEIEDTQGRTVENDQQVSGAQEDDFEYAGEENPDHDATEPVAEVGSVGSKVAQHDAGLQSVEDDSNDLAQHDLDSTAATPDQVNGAAGEPEISIDDAEFDFLEADEDESADPVTPSKQIHAKRKVLDDEDDLALFELDTPEPKRTRSS